MKSAPPQYGREGWGLTDCWDRHSIAGDPFRELSEALCDLSFGLGCGTSWAGWPMVRGPAGLQPRGKTDFQVPHSVFREGRRKKEWLAASVPTGPRLAFCLFSSCQARYPGAPLCLVLTGRRWATLTGHAVVRLERAVYCAGHWS